MHACLHVCLRVCLLVHACLYAFLANTSRVPFGMLLREFLVYVSGMMQLRVDAYYSPPPPHTHTHSCYHRQPFLLPIPPKKPYRSMTTW